MITGIVVAFGVYVMIGALAAAAHYEVFREWPRGAQLFMYWRDPK